MIEVIVGRIGRPQGVKGEVSVEVRTDDPDRRLAPGTVVRTEPAAAGPLRIVSGRVHSGRLMLTIEGVTDRTAAERLRNLLLVVDVDPDERPDDPEEFYDRQLVGLRVETVDGTPVGQLREVLHLPGQDVLAVRRGVGSPGGPDSADSADSPGGDEVLVPFVREFVPEVDIDGGRIVIDPPAGLLGEVGDEPADDDDAAAGAARPTED
ncbi:MAG: rRNA processing protein RimM [Actinomycetota bacterium]|nr:rRNA processing protein RimM [Actinomycetota bacterium]